MSTTPVPAESTAGESPQPPNERWRLLDSGAALLVARVIVGAVMIRSSIFKIDKPVDFLKLLREYDLFPPDAYMLMNTVAITLPWIELICGVALIAGVALRGNGAIMLAMLVSFTVVIALRTLEIMEGGESFWSVQFSCGCAGSEPEIIWQKLPKNLGLIALTMIIWFVSFEAVLPGRDSCSPT